MKTTINLNGREMPVVIKFRHEQYPDTGKIVLAERIKNGNVTIAKTTCTLIDDAGILNTASAYCSENDQFNKATGRKVALKRAVQYLPKEERTKIWKEYLKV